MSDRFDSDKRITAGATDTCDGAIPHLQVTTKYGKLRMPVRILYDLRDMQGRPFPETDGRGNYCYAFPGGGSMTEEDVLCLS